jgi:hypothetical protein
VITRVAKGQYRVQRGARPGRQSKLTAKPISPARAY